MNKLQTAGTGTAVVVIAAAMGFGALARTAPGISPSRSVDAALVQRGEYVSRVADCAACHTAIGGRLYAGGLAIESPVGTIYSTNITADKARGIGAYTLAEFDRAVRQGVRKDGATLYPAMPYPSFAHMSNDDVEALYAYLQHGVPAADVADKPEEIRWPLSMRWPLALWRGLFAPAVVAETPGDSDSVSVARGKYLVEGPGHCGACHTPRGKAMQEAALDDSSPRFLAGGTLIDGWFVPSLRSDPDSGLGRWSEEDLAQFLRSGRTDHAAVFGGMADVVAWSTRHATDADLHSIAAYLKTLGPAQTATTGNMVASAASPGSNDHGQTVYRQECAICHRDNGAGVARMFPPLAGNPVVIAPNPISLVKLVEQGAALPPGNEAPSTVAMPGYAGRLSDRDVADVVNYIRGAWGNRSGNEVQAADVGRIAHGARPAAGGEAAGWTVMSPQPYGEGWTFSPETHTGHDSAQ